ncbi:hypothetical protein pb186bvf_019315 [Paramecium bursaria]
MNQKQLEALFCGSNEGNHILNRYEPVQLLGQGTFGSVFRVIDKFQNLEHAIKVVTKQHNNKKIQDMLEREGEILKNLTHQNILKYLQSFETENKQYYIFKYIKGVTLKEYIKQIEISEIKDIVKQIIEGLEYIHQKDIIHCDIKPANIIINKLNGQLEVTIIDFGLSVDVSKTKGLTEGARGTINYMAPEQLQGVLYNRSVDIWALGILVYNMLTKGQNPFTEIDDNEQTCIDKIKLGKIKWPKQIDAQIKDFISRCLAVDVESRMSAYNCSKHPWIKGRGSLKDALTPKEMMKQFIQRENMQNIFKNMLFLQYLKKMSQQQEMRKSFQIFHQRSFKKLPFGRNSLDERQLKPEIIKVQTAEEDRQGRDMISTLGSKKLLKQLSFKNQPNSQLLPPLSSTPQKLSHPAYLTRKMNLSRDRNDSRGSSIGSRGSRENIFHTQLICREEQNSKDLNSDERTQDSRIFTPQRIIQDKNYITPKKSIASPQMSKPPLQGRQYNNQSVIHSVISKNRSAQKIQIH